MIMQERVGRGMALLDEKQPGWREKIDLDTLDVRLMDRCIIGQVFTNSYGGYFSALAQLGIDDHSSEYGFAINRDEEYDDINYNYIKLTETWKLALSA